MRIGRIYSPPPLPLGTLPHGLVIAVGQPDGASCSYFRRCFTAAGMADGAE